MSTSPLHPHRFLLGFLLPAALFAQSPLTLPDAVQRALQAHPTVAADRTRASAAQERIAEARAGFRPRIDFQESFQRGNNPVYVFGTLLTQRQFTASNFALDSLNRPDFVNNFQSVLGAEQTLWDAGRTRAAIDAARANQAAAESQTRATELALIARTARAYLEALLLTEAVATAEKALASGDADLRRAQTVRDAGRATEADVLSAGVAVAQLREQLAIRRSQRRAALAALNEAMGEPLEMEHLLVAPQSTAPAPVSGQRPELEGLRHQRESLASELKIAKAALWPQVSWRGVFEADRQRFVTRTGSNWFTGVNLKWTLWQGGADRARIRAAQQRMEAVRLDERALASRVSLEVKQAQEAVVSAEASVAASESAVAMAEESLRITRNRYEAGFATITDLLRAQSVSADAALRAVVARHGVRLAKLGVAAATGDLHQNSEVLR